MSVTRTHFSLFHTSQGVTKEVKFSFDKLDKVEVNLDLTVCSYDSIRGRNKTDHAYMNQKSINISGKFSERNVDGLFAKEEFKGFSNYKKNKLQSIQDLFLSFIKDLRLFYVYTRYKTYKNYVLKACSFSYSESISSMSVDLTFLEVMFRNNDDLYADPLVNNYKDITYGFSPLTDVITFSSKVVSEIASMGDLYLDKNNSEGDLSLVDKHNKIITSFITKGNFNFFELGGL